MKYCMRGGLIEGKEVVKGNSPKNDIYDVKLKSGKHIKASAGEIVMDKETLAKGPEEWVKFIKKEMKKAPDLFKTHFDDGGKPGDSYADLARRAGDEPGVLDKLHDIIMNTPSKQFDADDRRINPSSVKSKYSSGGLVNEKEMFGLKIKDLKKKKGKKLG